MTQLIPPTPLRSQGSFALHAWTTVAAWGAAIGVFALVGLAGGSTSGCLVAQDLGADDAGARADTNVGSDTGNEGGFNPQLPVADLDVTKCPGTAPIAGSHCQVNFTDEELRDKLPVQCHYRDYFTKRGADGLEHAYCGQACVCGFDGHWSCIDAKCAAPTRRTCAENMPCLGRDVPPGTVSCSVGCDGTDGSDCRTCTCVGQHFSCGMVPTK